MELENLKITSGEKFQQSLQKVMKENDKFKVGSKDGFTTPITEDRRFDRETPAKKVRRKLISYKDLDRPRVDSQPDLRKV